MDPLRELGLGPGASLAEVKRAYRALAKRYHPDSAGPAALPRFLAIQEAYELLTGTTSTGRPQTRTGSSPTPDPWAAAADRARATREAYRTRRTRPTGTRPGGSGAGPRTGERERRRSTGAARPPNRATPGSTSYDEADQGTSTPDWQGSSWYGASSGTYWTINPKEYADPRKHGPEYQARGRRADDGVRSTAGADWGADAGAEVGAEVGAEWGAAAGDATHAADASARWRPSFAEPEASQPIPQAGAAEPGVPSALERLLTGEIRTPVARVGLALVGWPPLAIGLGAGLGELSGCARFASGCAEAVAPVTLGAQLAIAILLLALPRLAGLATAGTLGMLLAALPATAALVPADGSVGGTTNQPFAALALVAGWLAGAALAVVGSTRSARGSRAGEP